MSDNTNKATPESMVPKGQAGKLCWYVVHTYSGYENKVMDTLKKSVENSPEMSKLIRDIRIPMEEVEEIRNGRRVKVQRKIFPGYVMVQMEWTTESWYLVRNTRGVTGFVGPGSEPIPLTDEEFERMTSCQGTIHIDHLEPGDSVRINRENLENAIGTVEAVIPEEHRAEVSILMFGKKTTIDVDISEVERL